MQSPYEPATMAEIEQFICRADNFGVLVHDTQSGRTVSIDAPEVPAIEAALERRGWTLTDIIVTHKHFDHIEGLGPLKQTYGCTIAGPRDEADEIDLLDHMLVDGDTYSVGELDFHVIATPGHTLGCVSFHCPQAAAVFAGDALFSLGCGRLLEGTAEQMHSSLAKLASLPPDILIYCGHEYTKSNAAFAVSVDPGNEMLRRRAAEVGVLAASGQATLPVLLRTELATNPFLRVDDPAIRARLDMEHDDSVAVFAELRARKDRFR